MDQNRSRKFNWLLPLGIVIILAVVIGALAYWQSNKNTNQSIKIGLSVPLTGEAASWGQNALAGVTLATNEINEKGGIDGKKIELITEDNKCTAEGANNFNKFINVDKVIGILGPVCSAAAGPALPIAQSSGTPTIIIAASAPDLTKIGDYIFRVYPSDAYQGKVGAEFVYNTLSKKKVAIEYVNNENGQGLMNSFKPAFQNLGGEVVYENGVLQSETDFKTDIAKIKASGADVLYLPVYPANAIAALKQIKEAGLSIAVVGADAMYGQEVVDSGYAEGVIYTVPKINLPEDFTTKINALAGYNDLKVTVIAPLSYDAANIMYSAIKSAGLHKNAIKDAIAKTSMPGVSNPTITFDNNRDVSNPAFDIMVIRGKESVKYQ
jgi:branched-chain amino acid transport system substrate-binding protein